MIANALFAAIGLTLALFFFLANKLRWILYRFLLVHQRFCLHHCAVREPTGERFTFGARSS